MLPVLHPPCQIKVLGKICCLLCSPSLSTREVVTLLSGNGFDHSVAHTSLRDVCSSTNPNSLLGKEEMKEVSAAFPLQQGRAGCALGQGDRGTEEQGGTWMWPCAHSSDSSCLKCFCGAILTMDFLCSKGQQCVCDHRAAPQAASTP